MQDAAITGRRGNLVAASIAGLGRASKAHRPWVLPRRAGGAEPRGAWKPNAENVGDASAPAHVAEREGHAKRPSLSLCLCLHRGPRATEGAVGARVGAALPERQAGSVGAG